MTTALHILVIWLCISIIFGVVFGFILSQGKKRYQLARRSLVQRERRVGSEGRIRL